MNLDAWPDDFNAGCLEHAARMRGVGTDRTLAAKRPGSPFREHLRMRIGGRAHLYRNAVLYIDGAGPGGGYAHVNGDLPRLTMDKQATRRRVAALGFPVAAGRLFPAAEAEAAAAYFRELERPACVKPNGGKRGDAVFALISDPQAFAHAFRSVAARFPKVLVEEHLTGAAVRFFHVAPRVAGVLLARLANVVGNGVDDVATLVAAKNAERLRRDLPGHEPIAVDAEALRFLALQGVGLGHVPPAGRRVFLRGASNTSSGGDAVTCADWIHPSYTALVETLCRSLPGLRVAGVDTVIRDPRAPAAPGNHWVLEINSAPGVVPFHFPWEGEPRDVAGAIVDRLVAGDW
ncbi:MAG TPA: hypothetical protein VGE72_07910 [Azospirillum sp.]